jgi:hypothetical protein
LRSQNEEFMVVPRSITWFKHPINHMSGVRMFLPNISSHGEDNSGALT